MDQSAQAIDDLRAPTKDLRRALPSVWSAFTELHGAALAEGALSTRVKELIALAIAVVKQCDGCVAYHAKGAARAGAAPDEVAEALGVALLMSGGPGSVYAPKAWQAYHAFAPSTGRNVNEPRPSIHWPRTT